MPVAVGLAAVVIALLVLLLLYAGEYLGNAIAHLIPKLPLIGNKLRDLVAGAAAALGSWAGAVWDSTLQPAADFILSPIVSISNLFADITDTLGVLQDTELWIVGTYVPREIASATKAIESDVTHVSAVVAADFKTAERDIAAGIHTAEAWAAGKIIEFSDNLAARIAHNADVIAANYRAVESDIADGIHTAEAWAAARVTAAETVLTNSIADAFGQAERDITALGRTVDADVQQLGRAITAAESAAIASAVGIITTDVDQAAGRVADDVTAAVEGAIDIAGAGFADIVAGLRAIDWADVTDIAGVTAATGALTITVSRYLEQCGMPNCRNLSGLGRFLEDLLSDVSLAALLAMLVRMVNDPEGAAGETIADIGGLATGTINLVTSLVGV